MNKHRHSGFHGVLLIVIVAIIAVAGALGYVLYKNLNKHTDTAVRWQYNQQEDKWFVAQGTAPACKQPFVF